MDFAKALREAMGPDMTQEQLEELSGVDQATVSRILRGGAPSFQSLERLERALPRLREIRNASIARAV